MYTKLKDFYYLCTIEDGTMKTVETREFRANLAEMLKTAANEPVLLDRGRKGLVLFGLALNPLKRLANSSNVLHMRDFRANLATYLDQVGEKLLFIRNADKVLLQIIEIPKPYIAGFREEPKIMQEDLVKVQVPESVPEPETVSVPEVPNTPTVIEAEDAYPGSVFDRLLNLIC